MQLHRVAFASLLVLATSCSRHAAPAKPQSPPAPPPPLTFAVLPAESDKFPTAARVTTERLQHVRLEGLSEPMLSKVSLEVVQLSIECVEPTPGCYAAVGKELAANQLLFAEIGPGPKPRQVQVKVTLFDVDSRQSKRSIVKVFASEAAVSLAIGDIVAEATRP